METTLSLMVFVPSSVPLQAAEEYISLCRKNQMTPDPDPVDPLWQNTDVLKNHSCPYGFSLSDNSYDPDENTS